MASRGPTRRGLRERFYRSVAETLVLLHTAPGYDRRLALTQVAETLSSTMELPLVWIGRIEPNSPRVDVFAAAGPAAEYAATLRLSMDRNEPGGLGPTALALREGHARVTAVDAAEFAPWRDSAIAYGFGWHIVAGASTSDGGRLVLSAYAREGVLPLGAELLDWAQRLANEMVRFWDHQTLLEHDIRMRRYRDAQRSIQRALLDQPDPAAVYHTLAHALVETAGAMAVDIYRADVGEAILERVALAGPMADAIKHLTDQPSHSVGPKISTPTLAFMRGEPVVRVHPSVHPETIAAWHLEALAEVGAIGCWPMFSEPRSEMARVPVGVFSVVTTETDAFDTEMCGLLDEIADAAGLALKQHEQRRELRQEQARQTYLALHDDLTHLPNRRALDRHLERLLERAREQGRLLAVGILDLDDLKLFNDRYGHAAGDDVLLDLATRVRSALRDEDYVARLGGDEFVLVFENLDRVEDLDPLLERVWHALQQPASINGNSHQLSASLGVALFPLHAQTSGAQLLRRADQAMYAVKARKRARPRWWALPPSEDAGIANDAQDMRAPKPHGPDAAALLTPGFTLWSSLLPDLVEDLYTAMLGHEGIARVLETLRVSDARSVKRRMMQHLRSLLSPQLEYARQRESAARSGVFNAASGLEEVWLLEIVELLRGMLSAKLGASTHGDRRPLEVVLQRLALERQWQLESMRELQRRRVAVIGRINVLAWSADSYLELIQGVVDVLVTHEEIIACAVGRPNHAGELTYEAVAGAAVADYLRDASRGEVVPIRVDPNSAHRRGASGRAWRTATIQRSVNHATDPTLAGWRKASRALGIASNVAVPLCPLPLAPAAILVIYSAYVGGFQSEDQQAFIGQIKTVLDLALSRLAPSRPGTALLPFFVRERWRQMVAGDAVEVHYQPVVRLATGAVTGLEVLARLQADDGSTLLPGTFLPALGETELLVLFQHTLTQAMKCRQRLLHGGFALDVAVNVPATALEDVRYQQAAAAALALCKPAPGTLLLEILESPMGTEHSVAEAKSGMQALRDLGFRLVEDDLGAGYSSLIRLRQWPFDRVKIDQAIVLQVIDDPLRTLRFIRQLIRLGHDLDLEVVVEGLETQGMIEAALVLGADFGQGFALARPMPQVALLGWLAQFHANWSITQPCTALGVLAAALVWEEQFVALPPDPSFWQRHAETGCATVGGNGFSSSAVARFNERRDAMCAAAATGPRDTTYRQSRERYFAMLAERVQIDEKRAEDC